MKPTVQTVQPGQPAMQTPAQTSGALLGKEPDKIVKALNNEQKEARIVAGAVTVLALLIAAAWAYWVNSDHMKTSSPTSTGGSVLSSQQAGDSTIPLSGPAPAVASVPPTTQPSLPSVDAAKMETLHADVYFDFSKSRLRDDAKAVLQEQADKVKDGGWSILIQGYTDPRGPAEYNKALGLRRAESVKEYLVQLGIPDSAITVASLGREGAICTDDTKECRQRNRRVHLELVKTGAGSGSAMPTLPPAEPIGTDVGQTPGSEAGVSGPVAETNSTSSTP
jgi:peptidoglycan-associated lipoprotein